MKAALPFVLAAVMAGCSSVALVPDRYYPINWTQARATAARAEIIVDLRPAYLYDEGHIPGALSIPLSQLWMRMDEMPASQGAVILVYADDPDRLRRGASMLRAEGFYMVHALEGGFSAWLEAGGPVSRVGQPPAM